MSAYSLAGDRYPMEEAERRGHFDDTFGIFLPLLIFAAVVKTIRRHVALTVVVVASVGLWAWAGLLAVATFWVALALALSVWRRLAPASFVKHAVVPLLSMVRSRYYRRHWRQVMFEVELDDGCAMSKMTPPLLAVRAARVVDALWVRPLVGQTLEHWERAAPRIAEMYGTGPIRVVMDTTGQRVQLLMARTPIDADKVRGLTMPRSRAEVEPVEGELVDVAAVTIPEPKPLEGVRLAIEAGRTQVTTIGHRNTTGGQK